MRNDSFDEIPRRIYDSVVHFVQFWPTTVVLSKSLGGGSYRVFGIDVLFGHRCFSTFFGTHHRYPKPSTS